MAQAADIRVMASMAFKEAYLETVPGFERATGHKVVTMWSGTVDMLKRLKCGEVVDLVIMSGDSIDELTRLGKIVPGSRVDYVKSRIGVAVRAGAPDPDIRSGEVVKQALLAAKSVAWSTGPSGVYLDVLFQRMGIADALRTKAKIVKGEPVGAVVARGEAEIGFQQISEILPVAGVRLVGPLPPDLQHVTVFAGGIHSGGTNAEAASALMKALTAPEAADTIRRHGLEPA